MSYFTGAASNFGINAVPASNTKNMFVPAIADNVPTVVVNSNVITVTCPSGTNVPLTAAAFPQGSGLYLIECNAPGNNDLISLGRVTISPAGTVTTASAAPFMNNVSAVGAVAGAVSTQPNQVLFTNSVGVPVINQNVSASLVYSITTTKIANF